MPKSRRMFSDYTFAASDFCPLTYLRAHVAIKNTDPRASIHTSIRNESSEFQPLSRHVNIEYFKPFPVHPSPLPPGVGAILTVFHGDIRRGRVEKCETLIYVPFNGRNLFRARRRIGPITLKLRNNILTESRLAERKFTDFN